jgi:hypothetical protein
MADNTTLNTGTGGDVIATDDIAGVKFQRVKIVLGADGVNGGDVSSSNALPISDNSSSITVDNSGTFAVQAAQSGTWTLGANSGVDIGDVTINNADGGPVPVKIGDGTNYLVVDTAHNDGESNTENHLDIAAKGMFFNGTTWDRMRGDTTNGLDVDVTRVSGNVSVIGTASTPVPVQFTNTSRTEIRFYAVAAAAGTTGTETAITLTKSSGTSATTTGTSFVVTNAKRFKINQIIFATRGNNTATAQTTTFNFRINTGGAVTTTSTPVILAARSATPATANAWDRNTITLPGDGIEIVGDGTLQFGITAAATYTTNAPTWDVVIIGYEY